MMSSNKSCIFCEIVQKKNTEILFEDAEYIAFYDITPAASYHALIIPKIHLDQSSLRDTRSEIVLRMYDIGQELLSGINADERDARAPSELVSHYPKLLRDVADKCGFHIPPFYSVNHLHLHVIYKVSEMNCLKRIIFRPNSLWFHDVESVLSKLRKKEQ